jgi:hypothetical protein
MLQYFLITSYKRKLKENQFVLPNAFKLLTLPKKVLFVLDMILLFSSIVAIIATIYNHYQRFNIIFNIMGLLIIILSIILICIFNNQPNSKLQFEYLKYNQKLDILSETLSEYNFNDENSINEIITSVNTYLSRKHQENKSRNNIILLLFSAFGTLALTILSNLDIIKMSFEYWIGIVIMGFLIIGYVCFVFIYRPQSRLQKEYINLVEELQDLKIRNYSNKTNSPLEITAKKIFSV